MKTVVITGASTGIGEACALHLDSKGWQVFAGVRKEADAERLRAKASTRLEPVIIDVTDQATISSCVKTVTAALGDAGLAGLVNNAGIGGGGPLEFVPLDAIRRVFDVNVFGVIASTQAFLPLIRKGHGRIVNMGSIGGRMAVGFIGPYNASKFALEALTDSLRMELRPWGIGVAIVEPGNIKTPIWDKGRQTAGDVISRLPAGAHELYKPVLDLMPSLLERESARGIDPIHVAKAVEHALASRRPKTRYLVGTDAEARAAIARVLPDRTRDTLVLKQAGLPR
jgi:NAD(P)-dependent dehydrogenase (short-subunit alcohol dehydrogenase family)